MMLKLLIIFMLLPNVLSAQEMSSQEFSGQIKLLRSQISTSAVNNFALHPYSKELIARIAALHMVTTPYRNYYVDLEWTNKVVASINLETLPTRRETLLMNMVDTLEGLANEIEYAGAFNGISRPEMNAALQRATNRTVKVRVSGFGTADEGISHTTRGGYVTEGAGEEISLSKAEAVDQSGQRISETQSQSSSSSESSSRHQSTSSYNSTQSKAQNAGYVQGKDTQQTTNHEQNPRSPTPKMGKQAQHQPSQASRPRPAKPPTPTKPPPPLPKPKPKPDKTPTPPATASLLYYLVIGVVILGIIITIGIIVYKLLTKVKEEKENERLNMHKDELPPEQLTTDTLLDKAMQAAAKENYHEAIRLLTIGALIILEHQQVISYKDSLTNGDYLKKLLVEKELHKKFKRPMNVFDKLIYGFQKPDRKDFLMFKDFYLDLESMQR